MPASLPSDRVPPLLRVATFNILHGQCMTSGEVAADDLRESVRLLDADILGLQEVDRLQHRSAMVDQAAVVADTLGARHWRYVPALNGTPSDAVPWTTSSDDDGEATTGPTFGVALVSRLPVQEWHVRRLPRPPVTAPVMGRRGAAKPWLPDLPRLALAAVVEGPVGPFTVITAHLSIIPGWNVAQLRAVLLWARALPGPQLLIGDLNLPSAVVRRTARGWEQLARAATFPSNRPRVQLDHVLGHGLGRRAVRGVRALQLPVSDHRALGVSLQL